MIFKIVGTHQLWIAKFSLFCFEFNNWIMAETFFERAVTTIICIFFEVFEISPLPNGSFKSGLGYK